VTFAAVGGYGRRLLGWKSDLDVRLLTSERPERLEPLVEAIFYPLWDAGLSVGHQVVTIDGLIDDARDDLPTATALLDFRPIAGDVSLAHALNKRAHEELFAPPKLEAFIERLQAEVRGRRERLNGPEYLLEPDLKSSAGGLRDLDCALWAAGARWKFSQLEELRRSGMLSLHELYASNAALELTWSVRNRLHRDAGRRSDRLTFAEQERIAVELGYAARAGVPADTRAPALVEAIAAPFMSDYCRHARSLAEVSERLLLRALPLSGVHVVPGPVIPPGLCRYGDALGFAHGARLEHEPALALQLIAAAVEHQLPVYAPSRDAIQRACARETWQVALRESPRATTLLVTLITETRPARFRSESILAELLELGLLTALIPEFAPVVSKAHHDTYHVYTVDVHSIYAVDHLRALARGDNASQRSLAAQLAQDVEHRSELLLAALLHDIGKARPGRGHAQRGAEMARDILHRLQLAPQAIEEICLLIREHLSMYKVAMHRDFAEPHTIAGFARLIGNRRVLAQLYLLTIADVCTTSPSSMTEWKNHMLDELYLRTEARLDRRSSSDAHAEVGSWAGHGSALTLFLETMSARYLRSSSPDEATVHARAAHVASAGCVHVACVPSRLAAITELCVVTPPEGETAGLTVVSEDQPGFLSMVAASLAVNRLEVCAAEVHTRRLHDGTAQAVDRFWVRAPNADPERLAARIANVERDLKRMLSGEISARSLLDARRPSRWSERPAPEVSTRVIIDHDASPEFTVIEVLTKDQPGLLFLLTETLCQLELSIALAKVSTEGARATDAFYVTCQRSGEKLASGARAQHVEQRLLAALGCEVAVPSEPAAFDTDRASRRLPSESA
jgi:[protein-PII] uridylyltransferase